ncbi:putative oxidoreductase [Neomicrococcus aestuarii]|uniref:Putative oxidoreductase n=1 Tax=Neomicrococcus aestuarii TaxID=556325 RepID=A0A7W8TRV3_9MICC|nr:DoxX family protein [Neomicrococcus aestuarii]MBB5511752.1 putative oxidoreductase [Neomicrococcus aestuarii]
MTSSQTLQHVARLVLRLALGFIMVAHGLQKYSEYTIPGTQGAFVQMGIPAAEFVAPLVATFEIVGGILLIIGFLVRPVAILATVQMLGALFMVHAGAGIYAEKGGYELVLILAVVAVTLALVGPGKYSIDQAAFANRSGAVSKLA